MREINCKNSKCDKKFIYNKKSHNKKYCDVCSSNKNYNTKICQNGECDKEFTPKSNVQKYCDVCKLDKNKIHKEVVLKFASDNKITPWQVAKYGGINILKKTPELIKTIQTLKLFARNSKYHKISDVMDLEVELEIKKEVKKEQAKAWATNNRDKINANERLRTVEYREKNRDKINEYQKQYRLKNKNKNK